MKVKTSFCIFVSDHCSTSTSAAAAMVISEHRLRVSLRKHAHAIDRDIFSEEKKMKISFLMFSLKSYIVGTR